MKVWEGKRFSVEVEDGREIARSRDAVSILAVDAEDRVLLVRQKRPAVGKELLELPAGLIDEGEAPLATAQRELREETGLRGGRWRELVSFWSTPGFVDERLTLFKAEDLEEGEPEPDTGEELEIVRWTRDDVESRLHELEDGSTLVGLLLHLRETA